MPRLSGGSARNGQISLINNVLEGSQCGTGSVSSSPPASPSPVVTPTSSGPGSTGGPAAVPAKPCPPATQVVLKATDRGTANIRRTPRAACTAGFRAAVRGHLIRRVIFSLDGARIASRTSSPFQVFLPAAPGAHKVGARVTFKDATHAKTLTFRYRACASSGAPSTPRPVAVHRMTHLPCDWSRHSGIRRGVSALAVALLAVVIACVLAVPAGQLASRCPRANLLWCFWAITSPEPNPIRVRAASNLLMLGGR